ncbi:MAG: universal stress protein [Planctomycetes bacterium]|nr:universal stress protein [Planctomycetota bacterium]
MSAPFKKVVIGLDLSPNSIAAFRWFQRELAGAAEVVVVHAVDTPRVPVFVRKAFPHFDEWMISMRRGFDDRLLELTRKDALKVESLEGPPVTVLLQQAAAHGADLIVVGAQGRHEGLGRLIGSTPERLLEQATVPVLVPRGAGAGIERILVAVDDSAMADQAAILARRIADGHEAELALLNVVPTWFADRIRFHASEADARDQLATLEREARQWLRDRARKLELGDGVDLMVETGAPDVQILHAAARIGAQLIVMGTRGEGLDLVPRLGSCARYVLRNAHVPVLFVPPTGI